MKGQGKHAGTLESSRGNEIKSKLGLAVRPSG